MSLFTEIIRINQKYNKNSFRDYTEDSLRTFLQKFEEKRKLCLEDITEIARYIVVNQIFQDGNHRTALELCYYLNIYCNNNLPRIAPYLLYAAIDFEYYKSMHDLSGNLGNLYAGNAIKIAIQKRAVGNIYSSNLKNNHYSSICVDIENLPVKLSSLQQVKMPSAGQTMQKKLFCNFAGFRKDFCHSTIAGSSIDLKDRAYLENELDRKSHALSFEIIETSYCKATSILKTGSTDSLLDFDESAITLEEKSTIKRSTSITPSSVAVRQFSPDRVPSVIPFSRFSPTMKSLEETALISEDANLGLESSFK